MADFSQTNLIISKLSSKAKLHRIKILSSFLCTLIYVILFLCYCPEPLVRVQLEKYLNLPVNDTVPLEPAEAQHLLDYANKKLDVRNRKDFGPVNAETVVIVVLVHRDLERLQYLIVSLAQVRDISTAMLIFSHGYYDENINHLIRLIDFCMVLQIYYPFSVQVYNDKFPGDDAEGRKFQRDANMTQRKHHWWWTANFVFDKFPWAKTHTEMVVFIDEASYVLPDLLHVYRFAKRSLAYVPDADVLSFGRSLAKGLDYNKLTVDVWRPPYDKGLAFNSSAWRKISSLGVRFCSYDDTSWSYSLLHLFERVGRGRAVMVACMAPRVVSTAVFRSGWHATVYMRLTVDTPLLYPALVQTVVLFGQNGKVLRNTKAPRKGNGGWNDLRDVDLCLHPFDASN